MSKLEDIENLLMDAIHVMAIRPGVIQDRLKAAHVDSLCLIRPADFPSSELRRKFDAIREDLTWCNDTGGNHAEATADIMDTHEAAAIGQRLWKLWLDIRVIA